MFMCLCGTVLSGQSLNSLQDLDAYVESSLEAPGLETTTVHPPGIDTGDTHVSNAVFPAGKMMLLSVSVCMILANKFLNNRNSLKVFRLVNRIKTFLFFMFVTFFFFALLYEEESEDERLHMEAGDEREHQGADFRKLQVGRRRRGAWGKRKHAATVEGNAYRIVWHFILLYEHIHVYL